MQTLPDCPSPQVCVCVCVCLSVCLSVCLCWALVVTYRLSCPEACEISVPQPKIKPTSPALEDGFLATGCLVAQSCPTLCRPMDYSLPGSSVHGILPARILEWVAISFSSLITGPPGKVPVPTSFSDFFFGGGAPLQKPEEQVRPAEAGHQGPDSGGSL